MKGALIKIENGALLVHEKGNLLEITKVTYENEKMTLTAKKSENLSKEKGYVSNKRSTYQRWKGEGALLKLIGTLVKVKGALFLCKKGHALGN